LQAGLGLGFFIEGDGTDIAVLLLVAERPFDPGLCFGFQVFIVEYILEWGLKTKNSALGLEKFNGNGILFLSLKPRAVFSVKEKERQ